MAFLNSFRVTALALVVVGTYLALFSGQKTSLRSRRDYTPSYPIQCTNTSVVAWTFDEGPSTYTQSILYSLRSMNVTATFHVSTRYIVSDLTLQSYVKALHTDGHIIGIRFNTLLNPATMTTTAIQNELISESNTIYSIIGAYPKYLVMPYGQTTAAIDSLTSSMGFVTTSYALDTYDYLNSTTSATIVGNVTSYMSSLVGGQSFIILSHDLYSVTNLAVNSTVNAIRANGYSLVGMDKCQGSTAYRTSNTAVISSSSGTTSTTSSSTSNSSGLAGQSTGSDAHNVKISMVALIMAAIFTVFFSS